MIKAENTLAANKTANQTQTLTNDLKTKAEAFLTKQVELAQMNEAFKLLEKDYKDIQTKNKARAATKHAADIATLKKELTPLRTTWQTADAAKKAYDTKETELKATKATADAGSD
jgi:hypothetical protein